MKRPLAVSHKNSPSAASTFPASPSPLLLIPTVPPASPPQALLESGQSWTALQRKPSTSSGLDAFWRQNKCPAAPRRSTQRKPLRRPKRPPRPWTRTRAVADAHWHNFTLIYRVSALKAGDPAPKRSNTEKLRWRASMRYTPSLRACLTHPQTRMPQ